MATFTGDREFDSKVTKRYVPAGHRQRRRQRAGLEELLMAGVRERLANPERRRQLDEIGRLFGDFDQGVQ